MTKKFPRRGGDAGHAHWHSSRRDPRPIGENGAGKSTLIKVLTGVHAPEEGEIFVDGKKVNFTSPVKAREHGIACVYQELGIVPMLSVVDNVFHAAGR